MEQLTDGDNSNVIQFGLGDGSFRLESEEEDVIGSLLNEFSDFGDEDLSKENELKQIEASYSCKLSFKDEPRKMTNILESQLKDLKDQVSRLKFYLDEMYVD